MQGSGGGGGGNAGGRPVGGGYTALRSRHAMTAIGEINVTPLVDVVLVLLLVFMVTAPMMSRGIDLSLPVANQPQIEPQDRVTVSVKADGQVYVGDKVVNLVLLKDYLQGTMGGQMKVVYLRADEALRYGRVIQVMDVIKQAGVEQVGLVYALPEEKRK